MSDWSQGYITDIDYTHGYYAELNPLRARLALLQAGIRPPRFETACELGFGQGLSLNIHGAASSMKWWGTDFNPAQVAFARDLAEASGAEVRADDQAFAEFCARDDLPQFDFIGVHGIWSWISAENRRYITDFVDRRLKTGGLLYISYNTLPGWANFAPMQHLMTGWRKAMSTPGHELTGQISEAIEFGRRFLELDSTYQRANPAVVERLEKLVEQNRHYLAHEYFNENWYLAWFNEMAEVLGGIRLDYAGSAHYLDHVDALNLTEAQQTFLREVPNPLFRESVRDFMVNQQFRRDYWIKGARRLSPAESAEALRDERVVLVVPREGLSLEVQGALGKANMNAMVYDPLLDLLANHKPHRLGDLERSLLERKINFGQVVQSVMVLVGAGHLAPVDPEGPAMEGDGRTERLNRYLMRRARTSSDVNYLASPITGGGVLVSRFQQLFLLALREEGGSNAEQLAEYVWGIIKAQGQSLLKEGKTLQGDAANLEELTMEANRFLDTRLTMLKALQVA